MMPRLIPLFAICAMMLLCPSLAISQPPGCPDTVDVHQQLTASVAGWKAILDDTPHRLATITFYDGPPEEKASLVNEKSTRLPGKETAEWHFAPQTNRQIWVACGYAGTAIVLAKSLPPNTRTCSVTYNTQQLIAGMPVIDKVVCR